MTSIHIDIDELKSAIEGISGLTEDVRRQRSTLRTWSPIELTSLSALDTELTWLDEQIPELEDVLGIARLLQADTGEAVVSFEATDFSLDDADEVLGRELGRRLAEVEDFERPEDWADFELYAELLVQVSESPDGANALLEETGPAGPAGMINAFARALNPEPGQSTPWDRWASQYGDYDPAEAQKNFERLADNWATASAKFFANGSMNGGISDDDGYAMVNAAGPLATAILFNAGRREQVEFDGGFLGRAGEAVLEWEDGDPLKFIDNDLDDSRWPGMDWREHDYDPMEQILFNADHNVQTAQGFAGNDVVLEHMLTERESYGGDAEWGVDHFDDILQKATVEAALDRDTSRNAALISSRTIELAGSHEIADVYDDEIGGILATYIQDVDRTFDAPDASGGVNQNLGGVPPWGINLTGNDLTVALFQVGDSDVAVSSIGDAAMRLNQVRLNEGATGYLNGPQDGEAWSADDGDPFENALRDSAAFRGYLEDVMSDGRIDDGADEAAARREVAEMFTMPLDLIPTDKAPLIGDYIAGKVKEHIQDGYVGNVANEAVLEADTNLSMAQQTTRLQALQALVQAQTDGPPYSSLEPQMVQEAPGGGHRFNLDRLRDHWGEATGPGDLSDQQIADILQEDWNGLPAEALNWIRTDWASAQENRDSKEIFDAETS